MTRSEYIFALESISNDEEISAGARAMLRCTLDATMLEVSDLAAILAVARDALAGMATSDSVIEVTGALLRRPLYEAS